MTHTLRTRLPHSGHTHSHTRWYYTSKQTTRHNKRKRIQFGIACVSANGGIFFIVTATGNRDKQENNKKEGKEEKKIGGVLPQEESATEEEGFFFSNWQSKGKNSLDTDTHTNTRARIFYYFLIAKGEHSLMTKIRRGTGGPISNNNNEKKSRLRCIPWLE